ncbi:M28 family peptidase [Shewanella sp. D64]|uniref:M28 family peptidase n=1 Tax=unclassified Shewanella TaxID=196818 RepID=UPI0022BA3D03|nr:MULTISPECIES: M28 family peptidase [unclassified Shewanella]MEC4726070.1 M28 family peptidase [Shewanella sp. D64]MEC4738013.1 M28 family peptidase [Shewanella sp. E94]WBJ96212.1 M28 family peptidase [Shewanella sp. MTB7]
MGFTDEKIAVRFLQKIHLQHLLMLASVLLLSACSTFKPSCKTQLTSNWVDTKSLQTDIAKLASDELEGRKTGSQGAVLTRIYINQRFTQIGLTPWFYPALPHRSNDQPHTPLDNRIDSQVKNAAFDVPFIYSQGFHHRQGRNVVGVLTASRPSSHWRLIVAHYDHLGIKRGKIYPGADDNASGIAAMLQLATYAAANRSLYQDTNLMFVATDAEEPGLYGGYALVERLNLPHSIPNAEQIELAVNLDMVGRPDRSNVIHLEGRRGFSQFSLIQQNLIKETGLCIRAYHSRKRTSMAAHINWLRASDHYPLHKAGIPWLYFGVPPHQDYHAPSDTVEKIDLEFLAAVTASAHQLLIINSLQLENVP